MSHIMGKSLKNSAPVGLTILILGIIIGFVLLETAANSSWQDSNFARNRLKQEVGQMIMIGFSGDRVASPGFRRVVDNLERGVIGGVLFLPHNISARSELDLMVREVKYCKCSFVPLIAIDEEGGTVERLTRQYGFPRIT